MVLAFVDDAARGLVINRFWFPQRIITNSTRLAARASMFSVSKAFVGSSKASIPQFWPNESDRASLMMIEASIFWPAEHRPRMSISTWSLVITTYSVWWETEHRGKERHRLCSYMIAWKRRPQRQIESWCHRYLETPTRSYWRENNQVRVAHTRPLVRFIPEMLHSIVNFLHLKTVVLHDGTGRHD